MNVRHYSLFTLLFQGRQSRKSAGITPFTCIEPW